MEFVKFPSIESFSHVWRFMHRKMDPQPIRYGAKIKLHGTNGGVRVNADGSVVAQSRTRDLTVEDDNYGFASWVARNKDSFRINPQIMEGVGGSEDIRHVTYFGEWAGKGIQNKDAVTLLDRKYFFVFAVQINDMVYTDPVFIEWVTPDLDDLLVLPWHHVFTSPVDWNDAASANEMINLINDSVEKIGERDPFIHEVFGIEGVGEGLVMSPITTNFDGIDRDFYSALTFKAKSEAHRVKATVKAVSVRMEVPEEARSFVDMFVTEARCEQALREACGGLAEKQRTSDFLKWLGGDVKKESETELELAGLEWKTVAPLVNKAAAVWFIKRCEAI